MIFNTSWFLIFFLTFYFFLWWMPTPKVRFFYVLICSAVFHYHFAGPAGVKPIIAMAVVTYFFGLALGGREPGAQKKWIFALGLSVPVAGLVFFKYRALLLGSLGSWMGGVSGAWLGAHAVQPALPLAISFFTFEFVHYLADVYHGYGEPIRSPFRFGFFCIFFPSIVSGPIKRFEPFLAQVDGGLQPPPVEKALLGLGQVLLGFFKKLVIADNATVMIHLLEKRPDLNSGMV